MENTKQKFIFNSKKVLWKNLKEQISRQTFDAPLALIFIRSFL